MFTHQQVANDRELWDRYINLDGDEPFDSMSADERLAFIEVFMAYETD